MSTATRVHQWHVTRVYSRTRERPAGSLRGVREDGEFVLTSPIVAIQGRFVCTRNHVYELVGPSASNRAYFTGADEAPLDTLGPGASPWYLDADEDAAWPPGSTVPPWSE